MTLPPWKTRGQALLADPDWNSVVEHLRRTLSIVGGPGIRVTRTSGGWAIRAEGVEKGFLAAVVTAGPGEEEDPGDERYWVRELVVKYSAHTRKLRVEFSDVDATSDTTNPSLARWVIATNLPELHLAPDEKHTIVASDLLLDPENDVIYERAYAAAETSSGESLYHIVWVWPVVDREGALHYVFNSFMPRFWESYVKQVTWVDADGDERGEWGIVRFCVVRVAAGAPAEDTTAPVTSSEWETPETEDVWTPYSDPYSEPPYTGWMPSSDYTWDPTDPSFSEGTDSGLTYPQSDTSSWLGSQFNHACCPDGAPVRFGWAGFGFDRTEDGDVDCTMFNGGGILTWSGADWRWYRADPLRSLILTCTAVEDDAHWDLTIGDTDKCGCSWQVKTALNAICTGGHVFLRGDRITGPAQCGTMTIWPM